MAWLSLAPVPARGYNPHTQTEGILMKSVTRSAVLKKLAKEMPILRQHYGVEQLALFGSFARDKASENSDIDLVVSLARPLGFTFIELATYLEGKLGRKVDLITMSTLQKGSADPRRAHIAKDIQESLIYVQG
jgi:hypothetical protein